MRSSRREANVNAHARTEIRRDEVKAIAEGLIGDLRRNAAKAEELRRVPDESIELLRSSGLLGVLQPASCGGRQLTMRAHVDAVATIGRGCNAPAGGVGTHTPPAWCVGR